MEVKARKKNNTIGGGNRNFRTQRMTKKQKKFLTEIFGIYQFKLKGELLEVVG